MKKIIILFVILSLVLVSCSGENNQQEEKMSDEDIAKVFLKLVYTADKNDADEIKKLINSDTIQKDGVSKYSYEDKYMAYLKDKYKDIPIAENEWEDMLANRYINFMAKMVLDNNKSYKAEAIRLKYVEGLKEFEYEVDSGNKTYKGSVRLEDGVIVNAKIDIKGK